MDILKHKDLYWNFAVNASFARNRLIDYPSELGNPALGGDYISGNFLRGKGKSYYNLYLFKFAGVDPETGQETFWKDVVDGDGKVTGREKTFNINEATQYEIGDALPDVTGGLRTSFRWKNFDFMLAAAYRSAAASGTATRPTYMIRDVPVLQPRKTSWATPGRRSIPTPNSPS